MINKTMMKEVIEQESAHRLMKIIDDQIENLISEAESVYDSHRIAKAMGNMMSDQHWIL